MNDHHNNNTNKQKPAPSDEQARSQIQMLGVLEDFLLLADPDTIRALDEHLQASGISLSADQLIRELGRLVTMASGGSDD